MKAKWPPSWLVQGVVLQLVMLLSAPSLTQSSAVIVNKGAFLSAELPTASTRKQPEEESTQVERFFHKDQSTQIWPAKLTMSVSLGLFIAVVWITMLASVPVLIHVLDDRPVTRTGACLAACTWIALFGGLYLFTNVIQFSSPHFEQVRSLTVIECIYFMAQILTTVGYGDIVPAYFRGRVFVCIYAVCSFLVIAELLAEMVCIVSSSVDMYEQRFKSRMMTPRPAKPSLMPCIDSLGIFIVIALIFICFFHYLPGEEKDWLTAVYMSVITMSTVGFGAVTPVTEIGMAASAFLMVLGVLALTRMVIQFSTYMMERGVWERFNADDFKTQLKDHTHGVKVSEVDFLCLTLLSNHMVSKGQLQEIRAGFHAMKDPRRGSIRLDHLYTAEAPGSDSDLYELPPALHSLPEPRSDGGSNTPELERPPQLEA